MKESERKIKGFPCPNKSHHKNPNDIPIWQLRQFEKGDDEFLATKEYYLAANVATKQNTEAQKTEQEFNDLIKEWVSAIKYKSLESQQVNHPAFLRIIAISDKVKPFVFEEFSKRPFMAWLKALPAIVGKDVAAEAKSFPEAVGLWKEWGKENGYLPK